ncbi:MAG: pilus assembly protein TadG-related protein [Hyphomicrobiaceae bacterium]
MQSLSKILAAFRRDERGVIALMFGVMFFVITLFAGVAIDYTRVIHERSQVATALDAAALAAGKALIDGRLSDTEVEERARNFFNQNLGAGERFGSINSLSIAIDRANSSVTLDASVRVPMTLMRIAGFDEMVFPVTAATSFEQQDIELSIALDVTGSMAGSKLDALKSASNDLFDILLPDGGTPNRVRIALAPYSSGVNAGVYGPAVTGKSSPSGNCTFEREGANPATEQAPATGVYLKSIGSAGVATGANCPRTAHVVPLTDDKDLLRAQVQSYRASGSTAGHLGTQWARYMISPEWAGIFTGNNAPVAYDDSKTIKAMILMTDGLFNTYGGRNSWANVSKSQALTVQMCDAMRHEGVRVYTVGFKLNDHRATQTLRDCAGSERNFFEAEDDEALRSAFTSIAQQINHLRLTN